ncbi:MAG: Ppx/GppA family phosphatase, partial [Psychrilyobacter sp.]|nr:Ppx/GppA family phosphatase [Psychrilyobacter sp.]
MKKAVIDIGTNSCRLFIGEVSDKKIEKKLLKLMNITKLGEDVDKNNFLLPQAMDRTLEVLKKYRAKIDEYGVKKIEVVATSATRDSKNREDFISRVREEARLNIRCISGREEANYSFSGANMEFNERIMVIDIGGGSTEFILGDGDSIEFIESFDIGAVRLGEKFFSGDSDLLDAKIWTINKLDRIKKYRGENFKLVGVAGTVTTHVSVALEMKNYDTNRVHMYKLTKNEIEKNLNLFLSCTLEERRKIVGLEPKRAEVVIPGTYLL